MSTYSPGVVLSLQEACSRVDISGMVVVNAAQLFPPGPREHFVLEIKSKVLALTRVIKVQYSQGILSEFSLYFLLDDIQNN